jgi:hypothetical protein
MRKETVNVYFKRLYYNLPGGLRKPRTKTSLYKWSRGRDFVLMPPGGDQLDRNLR